MRKLQHSIVGGAEVCRVLMSLLYETKKKIYITLSKSSEIESIPGKTPREPFLNHPVVLVFTFQFAHALILQLLPANETYN